MNKKELQKKLNQPYTQDNWKDIVEFVFPNVSELSSNQSLPIEAKHQDKIESFKQLGSVRLNDGKNLALFELKLKEKVNIIRNRVALNDIVSSYIDQEQIHGVLSIFEQGKDDYRFTFSARSSEFDEDAGDFVTKKTDTKRYTYVLGKNESCRTAAERFYQLSEKKNEADIAAIEHAFSVETLSKNFFKEYKQQYELFVGYLTKTLGYFTAVFNNDDKAIRDWVKLLLGRLVFIKFVQKKGWLGVPADEAGWQNGNYRFLEDSFESFEHQDNFYSQFLNKLFFEGFDQPNRPNAIFELTGTKVPFLSGGLFDNGDPKTKTINFPKAYFEGLFEFLEKYNFTIDENDTAMDREVGIDPEMLGHIFENLLEDNKDKGAFYTPKEIVRYMCQESLKEYLKTYLQEYNQWFSDEAKQKELDNALHNFITKKEAGPIIDLDATLAQALKDVKICDPAIGSGAFPMGLLNEIFQLVHKLYDASPDKVGAIWEMDTWEPDTVKLNIIQQSIYGVDIEKGAVEIARLRFWLSLVVDSEEPYALPHLDYKIVVGDSLVSKLEDTIIDIDWDLQPKDTQTDIFGNEGKISDKIELIREITDLQQQIFDPDCDDDALSLKIRNKKIDLLILQLEIMINEDGVTDKPQGAGRQLKVMTEKWLETKGWKQQIQRLKQMKQGTKTPLEFFDWKLDFPEIMNPEITARTGFDIVIGNPPYVQLQKESGKLAKEFENSGFETFTRMGDIYSLFYEQGYNLLKEEGNLIFITSNKWMKTGYGKFTRKFFNEKTQPVLLVDFAGLQIFETATVDTNILMFKKSDYTEETIACATEDHWKTTLSHYVKENAVKTIFAGDESWIVLNVVEQKIKSKVDEFGTPLSEWDIDIYRGVLTGYNEAFIIDEETKNKLIKEDPKSVDIIRPILRGRDVKKYVFEFKENYLIATFPVKHYDIENYNSIKCYLKSFTQKRLEQSGEKGSRKRTSYKWYETQDSIAYWDDFSKQKIVWSRLMRISKDNPTDFPRFSLVPEGFYILDSLCMITGFGIDKYIHILNSKYAAYYFFKNIAILDNGGMQMRQQYVENIPIPKDIHMLNFENKDEDEISKMIFRSFKLTNQDIEYINSFLENKYEEIKGLNRKA